MLQKVTIAAKITASGGAEGDTSVFDIEGGKNFKLTQVSVAFPSGTNGELEISIYRGLEKVVPYRGVLIGDAFVWNLPEEEIFPSGSSVICHYKNTNDTTTRYCFLLLIGELE
jgi:hypothetical protein